MGSPCLPKDNNLINRARDIGEKFAGYYGHVRCFYDASFYNNRDYVLNFEMPGTKAVDPEIKKALRKAGAKDIIGKNRGGYIDIAFNANLKSLDFADERELVNTLFQDELNLRTMGAWAKLCCVHDWYSSGLKITVGGQPLPWSRLLNLLKLEAEADSGYYRQLVAADGPVQESKNLKEHSGRFDLEVADDAVCFCCGAPAYHRGPDGEDYCEDCYDMVMDNYEDEYDDGGLSGGEPTGDAAYDGDYEMVSQDDIDARLGYDEGTAKRTKKRKLNEYDSLGFRSDTVSTTLDWISENVIEWVEDEERKAELQGVVDQIYDLFDGEFLRYSSSYSDLGNDPLNLLEKLAALVKDEGYELCADFITEQVENQRNALKETDYENGRDPDLDTDEPLFDIYCTYSDEQGGECDGDPRYEKVSFDDLYDTIVDIGRDFLNNNLKGSYQWSPVDRTITEDNISGISTEQWKNLDDETQASECTVNRLKIRVEPVQATEDTYTVIISGNGRIIKDTYGGISL